MKRPSQPVVRRSLFSWVFSESLGLQLLLVLIIAVTVLARVLPLEMQKRVINEAIRLRRMDLLLTYCGIYLAAVVTASGLKYLVNALQTIIAQRALTAMRMALYRHILTLPLGFFRNTQPGMVVNALITELTQPANFVGMALAVPLISVLTLVVFAVYLFLLNPLLAAATLAIYPLSVFLLPLLQRRVNRANKKRMEITRQLSSRIGDTITGIHEIHSNGAYPIENEKFDGLVRNLMKVRTNWSLLRDGIKVTSNFFTNLGPFMVFLLGGYLALQGRLELGALVAFLSAQEKLYDPWRELIDYYQVHQDGAVTYRRTMEYFDYQPEHAIAPTGRDLYDLEGKIEIRDLSLVTESGIALLDSIGLDVAAGQSLALVGFSGSGKTTLAQCIGQLYRYTSGNLRLGGQEVAELSKQDIARNVGFVSQSPYIFDGTIEENLLYACEALKSCAQPGSAPVVPSLDDKIQMLHQTGIFADTLRFGLNTVLTRRRDEALAARLIRVRQSFRRDFGSELAEEVEFFDESRYLHYSSIADNLLFGTPDGNLFQKEELQCNPTFMGLMDEADLTRPLCELGAELARQTIDILGNLPHEAIFFEQSPLTPEEIEDYKALLDRLRRTRLHQLTLADRERLVALALRFVPGRHKMVTLPRILRKLILEGRALFRERVSAVHGGTVTFYSVSDYIWSQTILNNIFFGTMKNAHPQAEEKINQRIIQLLIEEDFLETIIAIGMQFRVGSRGERLSGGQRQKLAIARTLLKSPRVLILDEATSALDNRSQARIQNLLETRWHGKSTLVAVVHRLDIIRNYDQIAVMKAGKIVEQGTYDELLARKGRFHELVGGR